jgi:lipid II:glycine glycyltransferase (peptidoglycan interpeptide bridge formation enzyme)
MLENLTDKEFNDFSRDYPSNTFFQSSYWGELKATTGWKSHMVGIKKNGKVSAATLLLAKKIPLFNKYIFYAPRGFLVNYDNFDELKQFCDEITKYVKKNKGIFVKINPYLMYQQRDINGNIVDNGENHKQAVENLKKLGFVHNGFTINYGKDLEPRWISVLDIEGKTSEELLKNMRSTTRWGINNSYKHGFKLVEIDEKRLPEFKKLMEHTGERRGFIDRPLSYYKNMYKAFSKDDNIKILLVELNVKEYLENLDKQLSDLTSKIENARVKADSAKAKRSLKEFEKQEINLRKRIDNLKQIKTEKGDIIVVAGGLFMTYGTQVISLFGASYREYMKFNGQYFLNFEMIKYAVENNYKKYNFLGITGEFNEDSPMYGLFDFKRGFNSDVVELIGEFNKVTNKFYYYIYNVMFFMYRKLKKWM